MTGVAGTGFSLTWVTALTADKQLLASMIETVYVPDAFAE
jgi:hypothetical protein